MTLSIFATQASPAVAGPADSSPEASAEPSQSFSTVLQQEGQQDSAGQTDVVNSDQVGSVEAAVTPLPEASEEAVAALVSALLGSMPTSPEAQPDDVESPVIDELPEDFPDLLAGVSPPLNTALFTLSSIEPISAEAGASQSGTAVSESQLLPPGGKALPAWSMLLNAVPTSNTDSNVAVTPAANDPAAEGIKADAELSAALAGSVDSKAFQTLLRGDPMLATLATNARNALDNFNGSAGSSLIDTSLPSVIDSARVGANISAPANQTSAELIPGLPLRSPAFGTLLANQVLWQAKVGNNEAAIRLDPPELGPIDVRISQVDNETHLHFTAGHGLTRDQLEQSIPRLRELFSQGGLSLGQVLVEQGSRDNASQRDGSNGRQNTANAHSNTASDSLPSSVRLLNGLIDDYA